MTPRANCAAGFRTASSRNTFDGVECSAWRLSGTKRSRVSPRVQIPKGIANEISLFLLRAVRQQLQRRVMRLLMLCRSRHYQDQKLFASQDAKGKALSPGTADFTIQCFQDRAAAPNSRQDIVRGLEPHGITGLHEVVFQVEQAQSDSNPGLEFLRVER